MKVLWVGDAVASTGFSRCTHAVCSRLHSDGHEVHVLALNYYGDPHPYPYPIYPCVQPLDGGRDPFGVSRLPRLVDRLDPDLVIFLNDPWNIPAYIQSLHGYRDRMTELDHPIRLPRLVGWLAVDAKNQNGHPLNDLDHVVTWTDFADAELRSGGYEGPSSIVPLGVDPTLYYPRDREESRRRSLPEKYRDHFVVGVVGRNQPRKRLDLTLAYFAEWVQTYDISNACLFLHVAPTGERGCDIRSLVKYYGLKDRVLVSNPDVGVGIPEQDLPIIYSSFDVYWTTTQGEGFGLPCLESMACGVPCVVPDFSGLGSWSKPASYLVPCTSSSLNAPLNSTPYTVGGIVDKQSSILALQSLYTDLSLRDDLRQKGLSLASSLTWTHTAESFVKVISSLS